MATNSKPEPATPIDSSAEARQLGPLSHELISEIIINAPVDTVWAILTDLDRYHEWNPFVVEASGSVGEGSKLSVRIQPVGRRPSTFSPTVTAVDPQQTFEWLGRFVLPGVFDGRHRFELEPMADNTATRLRQSERFTGLLVPLLKKMLNEATLPGFAAMNKKLRERAEATVTSS